MTACFSPADIARLATDRDDGAGRDDGAEDAILDAHFAECLACRRRLDADRELRAQLAALPRPELTAEHRRALAAELLARAEQDPQAARRRWPASVGGRLGAIAGGLAAAAGAMLLLSRLHGTPAVSRPELAPPRVAEEIDPTVKQSAHEPAAPVRPPPRIAASGGATLSHQFGVERDVLTLVDGIVEIDTRSSRNVDVRVGNATIRVDDASVTIRASKHAIVSVHVVVGAAHISAPDQQVTLERDSVWLPGPSTSAQSLSAFRDAWIALRAGKNVEAMELFDRVTDPVAAEEATYWAAVAAHRSGDAALAKSHADAFLRKYPQSEYADGLRQK